MGRLATPSVATNAINIANAAGTNYVSFDTTNSRVGIGSSNPGTQLDIANATTITSVTHSSILNIFSCFRTQSIATRERRT